MSVAVFFLFLAGAFAYEKGHKKFYRYGRKKYFYHDNFFDLGGHSLLAIQTIARFRQDFGVEIPIIKLFQSSTIAALAEAIFVAKLAQFESMDIERVAAEIDLLSEEELLAMLAQENES